MIGRAKQFTVAGGPVSIHAEEIVIQRLVLTPAAAAVNCDIKENGTGGTVVLSLQAAANGNSVVVEGPIQIRAPFLSAIAGAGGSLTVVM